MALKLRITPKQQETLDFIRDFIAKNGESPTISELSKELRLKSLRSVTQRLESLETKGFITRERFKHRGISLLEPLDPSMAPSGTERIPVIASAGCDAMQVYAQEQYDEFLMVDKKLLDPRKEIVAIKAAGNSMTDFGLRNGDYALIEVTGNVQDGDRIAVIIGEMAVIKKLKRTSNAVILESESKSKNYPPIVLKEEPIKIFGKVLRVIPSSKRPGNDFEYVPLSEIKGDESKKVADQ